MSRKTAPTVSETYFSHWARQEAEKLEVPEGEAGIELAVISQAIP